MRPSKTTCVTAEKNYFSVFFEKKVKPKKNILKKVAHIKSHAKMQNKKWRENMSCKSRKILRDVL